jgi:hypothetical protein
LKPHAIDATQTNNAGTSLAKKRRIIIHDSSSDEDIHQTAGAAANTTPYGCSAIPVSTADNQETHLMNTRSDGNSGSSGDRVVPRTIHTETVTEAQYLQ